MLRKVGLSKFSVIFGRTLGLLALIMAFIGGVYINTIFGIILVFLAIYLGSYTVS